MSNEALASRVDYAMESPEAINTSNSSSPSRENDEQDGQATLPNVEGPVLKPFFPSKTDKPKPHVCTMCTRPFARLEHLKRHERSHTKEKPFTCPECSRSFARRDLLLRHQQKLHTATTPSSRPRHSRRESNVSSGRVKKNGIINTSASNMRPRAATMSHLDSHSTAGIIKSLVNVPGSDHNVMANAIPQMGDPGFAVSGYQYRGMSHTHQGSLHTLPKINTSALPTDQQAGPRTAPVYGQFPTELSMNILSSGAANTINPNQLHMRTMSNLSLDEYAVQYPYLGMLPEGDPLEWASHSVDQLRYFAPPDESAIETSSPSVMDTNSPGRVSDGLPDGTNLVNGFPSSNGHMWNAPMVPPAQMMPHSINVDFPPNVGVFSDITSAPQGTASPGSLLPQGGSLLDTDVASPPQLTMTDSMTLIPGFSVPAPNLGPGEGSNLGSPTFGSELRHSSITTVSSELINDQNRSSVLSSLAQHGGYSRGSRAGSLSGSPSSPLPGMHGDLISPTQLPATPDLQRYLATYIAQFHPHMPFLHIPSLNFESSEHNIPSRLMMGQSTIDQANMAGGGWCLMLAMTAVGALHEGDIDQSSQLFEAAKNMTAAFLDQRHQINMRRSEYGQGCQGEAGITPLWLIQAMLLNVIYGYNCGDKVSAEIASNQCSTLVSLARSAELARPHPGYMVMNNGTLNPDVSLNGCVSNGWTNLMADTVANEWLEWKIMEERKRTLYAIFILSSSLVVAYAQPPAVTNSEIWLNLPCDEALWTAENAGHWRSMGGGAPEEPASLFHTAFRHLLTESQRQSSIFQSPGISHPSGLDNKLQVRHDLKTSGFGSLVLIYALHNYIWESKQRHLGRKWTQHDTEMIYAHIEPALQAWSRSWASNSISSSGIGPVPADCLPLLHLAHMRLLVNFARPQESLWEQEVQVPPFVATGISTSSPHSDHSQTSSLDGSTTSSLTNFTSSHQGYSTEPGYATAHSDKTAVFSSMQSIPHHSPELPPAFVDSHLRQAAGHAIDSLGMLADIDQEGQSTLSLQGAVCLFECGQVISEWVGSLQDHLGPQVGFIGGDFQAKLSGMLGGFDDEDRALLHRVFRVVERGEATMAIGMDYGSHQNSYLGTRVLILIALELERNALWQMNHLMAQRLRSIAVRETERALLSLTNHV